MGAEQHRPKLDRAEASVFGGNVAEQRNAVPWCKTFIIRFGSIKHYRFKSKRSRAPGGFFTRDHPGVSNCRLQLVPSSRRTSTLDVVKIIVVRRQRNATGQWNSNSANNGNNCKPAKGVFRCVKQPSGWTGSRTALQARQAVRARAMQLLADQSIHHVVRQDSSPGKGQDRARAMQL